MTRKGFFASIAGALFGAAANKSTPVPTTSMFVLKPSGNIYPNVAGGFYRKCTMAQLPEKFRFREVGEREYFANGVSVSGKTVTFNHTTKANESGKIK